MEGGRREPERRFPLLGLEKHAQPWLWMWEQQSLESMGLGIKEKVLLPARSYPSRDGSLPVTPHPINPEAEPQAFLGQAQEHCAVIPAGFQCPGCRHNPAHLHCAGVSLLWRPRWVLSSGLRACLKQQPPICPPSQSRGLPCLP